MADKRPFYPELKFWQEFYTTKFCSFDRYNQIYLMDVNTNLTPSEKLSQAVVKGMQEKKASDIVLMDLRNVKNAVADFFVLCTGTSDTQIDAIAESVDEQVTKETQEDP